MASASRRSNARPKKQPAISKQPEPASAVMLAHLRMIGEQFNREIAAQAAAKAAGKAVRA